MKRLLSIWRSWSAGVLQAGLVAGLSACAGGAPHGAAAQDVPRFPFGTPVVLLPVQSTVPAPDGAWPGRAETEEAALRTMDAELEFAFAERRGAEDWVLPPAIRRRLERNPLVKVNPERLAYQGLFDKPDKRELLYEPLHSELRAIAALFDTRYLVLPVALRVETLEEEALAGPLQRAVLLLAMIDIRRSLVIWHGEIGGDSLPADSGGLLASLAERLAMQVAPS